MILRYQLKKFKIRFKNRLKKKYFYCPNELLIKKTITKLLNEDKTTIHLFPTENIIYIQSEKQDYTIILGDNNIKILFG